MQIKFTKNELRNQQRKLIQLEKYLPTLQLKKALLQVEVNSADGEIQQVEELLQNAYTKVEGFSPFVEEKVEYDLSSYIQVVHVKKQYENVAGVEIPTFQGVLFKEAEYALYDTPEWLDTATNLLRECVKIREHLHVLQEKKRALEKELREVSIRVNLFEKVLIPRSKENIKKIKIFLGDQFLAAVSQAKVAKRKILEKSERL